jgi:hypothetical protein
MFILLILLVDRNALETVPAAQALQQDAQGSNCAGWIDMR